MIIIGAGGHAREVLDILPETFTPENLFFYDDLNPYANPYLFSYRILQTPEEVKSVFTRDPFFILGIGGPSIRKMLSDKFIRLGGKPATMIASSAQVSRRVKHLGEGVTVMHAAFISADTSICEGALINHGAVIHHDSRIGVFTEIAPLAVITGHVKIGDYSFIGANATVLPDLTVGSYVIVGAGAVVTRNIPDNTVVTGIPAKTAKKQEP